MELGALTFDANDPHRLAQFWATMWQTSWRSARILPEAAAVDPAGSRPLMLFLPVPEAKTAKNRCHLDLHTDRVEPAVDRAVAAGATVLAHHDEVVGRWVVLADPEGNEFCIVEDVDATD